MTSPSRIAAAYAPRFGLSIFVPPLELGASQVSAVVSAARGRSDLIRWLVEFVLPSAHT